MEDDIIFLKMEEDLNSCFLNQRRLNFVDPMEDDLNLLVKAKQPPKLILCSFNEKHSYFRQPHKHNNQINIGKIKETKTKSILIGCDIIVN
jgi:hypothetical protein